MKIQLDLCFTDIDIYPQSFDLLLFIQQSVEKTNNLPLILFISLNI
jgi:hypothetical protein